MAPRVRVRLATAIAAVLVAVLLPACGGGGGSGPDQAVAAYLKAWNHQDYAAMAKQVLKPPADFEQAQRDLLAKVRATAATHTRRGAITQTGDRATVKVANAFTSPPWGAWTTTGVLALLKRNGTWRVQWSTATFDQALVDGTHLQMDITWPDRAPVLGAGGQALTVLAPMTRVGVQGSRITDPAALTNALLLAGATQAQIDAAVKTAGEHPDWFVPVVEITAARYGQLKDAIYPVPGTVFQQFSTRQALTPGLGAHIVGAMGPITAEQLTALGAPYGANDTVGRSGIEAQYQKQLAGSPGATIRIVSDQGSEVAKRAEWPQTPGTAVQTTIDPTVQRAAEAALASLPGEGAIVAVRASTGEILGSASVPTSNAFDIALRGQYPPGSTFKIVTTADLLEHGFTPSSPVTCPASVNVGGQVFRNFEGEAVGALDLTTAFALSCNNAFINAVKDLPADTFPAVAAKFGIGTKADIGVAAYGGSVPLPTGASEQAATAIGQAKVTVSPLTMAGVAAAVASGTWHAPRLVAGAPNDTVAPVALDPGVVSALQDMTAAVVARGTAAGAGLPAGTHGKTGTAEFGPGTPPQTHAWFVGYRGDVAFAVLVPGGGVGGAVAAPIAARFLTALG